MADDRVIALQFAVGLAPEVTTASEAPDVVTVAGLFYKFLTETSGLAVTVTVDRVSVGPFTIAEGAPVAPIPVAATDDNNTITFTVSETDDHGQPVSDTLTVVSSDTSNTIGTMVVDTTTQGAVVTLNHVEGEFTVTFTDPAAPSLAPLEFAVTVGPGAPTALTGTATVA